VSAAVVKVAVTETAELMVKTQVPVPEQPPPDQPAKVEPDEGEAVKVMDVPAEIPDCEQVEPQEILPPETVPVPVPDFETERV